MVSKTYLIKKGRITGSRIYRAKVKCIHFYGWMYGKKMIVTGVPEGRKNRFVVKHPYYNRWVIGFISYDGQGLVIESPIGKRWNFFKVVDVAYEFPHKRDSGVFRRALDELFWTKQDEAKKKAEDGKYPYYQLSKAVETEKKMESYLKSELSGYVVFRLPRSGFKMGGDIFIIPKRRVRDEYGLRYSFDLLKKSHVAMEVLGVTHYKGKDRLNHRNKNFMKWIELVESCHTLPVISFFHKDKPRFLIATQSIILKLFFWNKDRPITTYTRVEKVLPYTMDIDGVMTYLKEHRERYCT